MTYIKTISLTDKAHEAVVLLTKDGTKLSRLISDYLETKLKELDGQDLIEKAEKFSEIMDECDEDGLLETAASFSRDFDITVTNFIKLAERLKV